MASNFGHPGPALSRAALERYGSFNVFQLMRLLLLRGDGGSWPPERRLRFRAELGASFQGTEITRLQLPEPDADGAQAGPVTLHIYGSLYLGLLSWWSADSSPNQEATLALLDRSLGMFVESLEDGS